jgi:DNA-binding NarL/FixJ family response regulator
MGAAPPRSGQILGREEELIRLRGFLAGESEARALVLTGEPGVGKTTLWEGGVAVARERGFQVLVARPGESELRLSFAALADLLEGVEIDGLAGVSVPQRRALEVAILRAEPGEAPVDSFAVAAGFTSGLSALAERGPVLVAVDDVPWLDRSSAQALGFAARRLRGPPIRFLLARRPDAPSELERAFEPAGLGRLEVGGLSLGATRSLLFERLGLTVPRRMLRRLFEMSEGNPLVALELGRVLVEQGLPALGDDLPVPDTVEELLGTRVAGLPGSVRRVLLAVSLDADLGLSELRQLAGEDVVDDAVEAGVLVADRDRVRASHPLLSAAARKRSRSRERRDLHLALAGAVLDQERRAWHLGLAADRPDDELAGVVATAAAAASGRGNAEGAVVLSDLALRLTPDGSEDRNERLLALGECLVKVGEKQRVTDLLEPELDALPPGAMRVRACQILTGGVIERASDFRRYLSRALEESRDDPELHAVVVADLASADIPTSVEKVSEAEAMVLDALSPARGVGPETERVALLALAWIRSLGGRPIDDVCERFRSVSSVPFHIVTSPERVAAQRLVWRGELDRARAELGRLHTLADERGEANSYALLRLHLCELALRAGDWDHAERLLDEWAESSERALLSWPMYERCRALLAAGRGALDEAERWADEAIALAEAKEVGWDRLEALRARGMAALLARQPFRAAQSLRVVWKHTLREGVLEPGVFPVAPELVEALVELDELGEASRVTERLRTLADEQDHPWGRASASRCEGAIALRELPDDTGAEALSEAAAAYERLGLRYDRARSLLVLGRAQRRARRWAAAREALEEATAVFEALGSDGWAEQARSELARVGARRPAPAGTLSEAEARVARLAADGLSNKEIAAALFVTVHTVERHLSRAYAKLGVHSRTQLAKMLPPP